MLARTLLAVVALAAQATAADDRMPYRAETVHKMSVRELFGVVGRSDDDGYKPAQAVCGAGNSCAQACGAGYETCPSGDGQSHCYNPSVHQICCPDLSGDSCDAGYYCTKDNAANTWCCPNSMDLVACAAAFHVQGNLASEISTRIPYSPATSLPVPTSVANATTPASSTAPPGAPTGVLPFPGANSTSAVRPAPSAPTATLTPPVVAASSHVSAGSLAGLVLVAAAFVML